MPGGEVFVLVLDQMQELDQQVATARAVAIAMRSTKAPEGWIVTGYPWQSIKDPAHQAFLDAYQARFDDYPRAGSIVGYNTVLSIAAAITRSKLRQATP